MSLLAAVPESDHQPGPAAEALPAPTALSPLVDNGRTANEDRPVKVVFDARYLTGQPGGVATYSEHLLRELTQPTYGASFTLVTRRAGVAEHLGLPCSELVFPAEPRSFRTLFLLAARLRDREFDVFHSPFNILPSRLNCGTVVTIHDLMQLQNRANISTSSFVQATAGQFWRRRISHAA